MEERHAVVRTMSVVLSGIRHAHRIALVALVLGAGAMSLAVWNRIDIQAMNLATRENIKQAIATTRHTTELISEQALQVNHLSGTLASVNEELQQIRILNLIQEHDLCSLRQYEVLPQGFLGVELAADLPQRRGVVIKRAYPNCPACAAGLQDEDIIVSYNGTQVWSKELLMLDIKRTRPLTPVEIDVLRGKEKKRFTVIIVSRKPSALKELT